MGKRGRQRRRQRRRRRRRLHVLFTNTRSKVILTRKVDEEGRQAGVGEQDEDRTREGGGSKQKEE